ncbi:RdgB/HAM1 family non-canonical purine NTP pyrophosphatase [Homoserinimonas sp. OAct 916]|uniref:RdgB/HAM1 family non-canonical purine NTP pyrophosphatase n=1 Tax=Homoserinimonas sp. OAct 916 TaxID=2211450 RepID=UPI000DBE73CF|nr:RdgB/HAM1 family non-canonical purine NTP pyrophosphatase [Homoserinimonas sp. OAct 916]
MSLQLVLATHNQHKVDEFRRMLERDHPHIGIVGYDGPEPVEDGTDFSQNALIKARAAAQHTGKIALADDSGLCVDILGGAPGIFSARWAGSAHDATANRDLLLDQLSDISDPHRTARFVCTIALVVPETVLAGGHEEIVEGIWPGSLATAPRGTNGFAYDPIFIPEGMEATSAELAPEEKNRLSHRARALSALGGVLATTLENLVN